MNPPTGDMTLDSGWGMAWVDAHGAHLVDYASCHLEPDSVLAAVTAALESCAARERPEHVSDRAWLLSALRRECATGPGPGFQPGPGGPDHRAVRRAWSLADPLGAETLRLLYRHELPLRDLVYVLALPLKEAGRLVARTQDVVEILVSGLDGLARGRPICPEIGPLAAAVFPDEPGEAADFGAARTALLRHIVTCVVCKRPINIRYTVPQILSRPPVADLTAETRQRLLDALNRVRSARAERAAHRPPSSFGMPLPAPVSTAPPPAVVTPPPTQSAPVAQPPAGAQTPSVPQAPPALPAAFGGAPPTPPPVRPSPGPGRPPAAAGAETRPFTLGDKGDGEETRPGRLPSSAHPALSPGASTGAAAGAGPGLPDRPVRPISQEDTQPSLPWPSGASKSRGAQRPGPFPGPSRPAGPVRSQGAPEAADSSPAGGQAGPSGVAGPTGSSRPAREVRPVSGEHAALAPGEDTPLYNALLSQIRAREALAHAAEAVPASAVVPGVSDAASAGRLAGDADLPGNPPAGTQIRIVKVLARVGSLLRATALRIVIVVVAGAAGTVTGINLFAPAPQPQQRSLEAGVAQASADPAGTEVPANPSSAGETGGAAPGAAAPQITVTANVAGGEAGGSSAQGGGQSSSAEGAARGDGQSAQAGGDAQAGGPGTAPETPASPGAFLMGAWGVQAPSAITLDAFGRGTLTLSTTSGKPVKWRISAPGLVVEPSSGTLKPGHTLVLTVRALRVRYWCGVPSPRTAPLELHAPKGKKGTATVRWSTC